ncbi:MAG: MoaD/ThiS family protein [Candidatus Methylomirabilis oxyfera]|nr:MoaD/ThiS family protein [Candidatus Methylomirabilis oxyfera]
MRVFVPTPLRAYTGKRAQVDAEGSTLGEALTDLDRRYPGFRFRIIDEQDGIREHIKIFINQQQVRDLAVALGGDDEIQVVCALSGG